MRRRRRTAADDGSELIYGAHPVAEALEARGHRIERILVAREAAASRLGRLLKAARRAGVPVTYLSRDVLRRKLGAEAVHQSIAAIVAPLDYATPDEVIESARRREDGLVVVLDGIEDPRNLGAVLRSAAAAGCDGVLLGHDRTVGVTPVAVKAAAGAAERLPIARDPRLPRRLDALRDHGFTVVGLDPRGATTWERANLIGPTVIVAGGEGRGLRPGLAERCNLRVAIPLQSGVESLNLSVAVGIMLFEVVRQRRVRTADRLATSETRC